MPRSTAQSRKAAELSKPLHHELSVYALAAGAAGVSLIASSQLADAQIIYTATHVQIGANQKIPIDFNHDGLTDIIIREIPFHPNRTFVGNIVEAEPDIGGGVKQGYCIGCAAAMPGGSRISSDDRFVTGKALMSETYSIYYFGSWAFSSRRYLGVRFLINGETHYGWARMNVNPTGTDSIEVVLTGFAYETQANKPINAGETGVEGEDRESSRASTEMSSSPQPEAKPATLGALALGAGGLAIWRRLETESQKPAN
jgi:hypothetical protein